MGRTMNIGHFNRIVLLGGGKLLRNLCLWATSDGAPISVVTAPRHADEVIDGLSLSQFLTKHRVPFIVTSKIDSSETRDFIGSPDNTFFLSLGAAWIFKPDVIKRVFDNKLFNLHGTRLPQNRGGGGFSWQILTGNRFGFCTLHLIDGGVDTGDIVAMDEFLYPATCRKPIDYERVYIERNFRFLLDFIEANRSGAVTLKPRPQSECFSSYWPRLDSKMNGWIDWSMDAHDIEALICAFDDPYCGAQTKLAERVVHLKDASLNRQDGAFHPYQSGIVYRKGPSWLCVAVNGCALVIESATDSDGKSCFNDIAVGDRFTSPIERLERSKFRPIYTAEGLKTSMSRP